MICHPEQSAGWRRGISPFFNGMRFLHFACASVEMTKWLSSRAILFFCHPELVEGSHTQLMAEKQYYVYILMNKWNTVSYIGVTSDLMKRLYEHKNKLVKGFTQKYNIDKLVYFEETAEVMSAIEREKQLKRWSRKKKVELIKTKNNNFEDLSKDWTV